MGSSHRIAILADIHANVWALDAVLSDVRRQGVDVIVNLGDVLYGPLDPRATFERLQHEAVLLTVRGNQDREPCDGGEEAAQWLQSLPETAVFEDEIFL